LFEQLNEVIRQIEHVWPGKRLLVLGDVMLDQYITGNVGRISPEAPVPVVWETHRSEQPGGGANVAMNLARLGADVVLAGFAGGDENESRLTTMLQANGIRSIFMRSEGFPTITKVRILGGRQQMLRLDSERRGRRPDPDYQRLLDVALAEVPGNDAVVLSDYGKGAITAEVCRQVIQAARAAGIPVLVDPKSTDFGWYRGATTVCPNMGELSAAARPYTGSETRIVEELLGAAERMVADFDLDFMTATLSEKGIALVRAGSRTISPAVARQVFDVSGAGDTVIAVMAMALASGLPPETAVKLANVGAGVVVGKVGTVPLEKHELLSALAPAIALHAADKIVSRAELANRVATWRANGDRVAFSNGCFDLLHIGHITLLEEARRTADKLIVAINSDDSVHQVKGANRPIVGSRERARVLAALAAVDAVVVFDELTPLQVILETRPDVLVKGGDYTYETTVGAREVEAWGGQVRILPLIEGYSTAQLIARGTGTF